MKRVNIIIAPRSGFSHSIEMEFSESGEKKLTEDIFNALAMNVSIDFSTPTKRIIVAPDALKNSIITIEQINKKREGDL